MSAAMNAGRGLDALVAEKVMGWKRPKYTVSNIKGDCMIPPENCPESNLKYTWNIDFEGDRSKVYWTPPYSTDISAAWEVVEKMNSEKWDILLESTPGGTFFCSFYPNKVIGEQVEPSNAPTAPLAICLAALKACGVEV